MASTEINSLTEKETPELTDSIVLQQVNGEGFRTTFASIFKNAKVTDIKTANYSAVATDIIRYDPSGGSFTIEMPPTPNINDSVTVKNVTNNTTAITVDGNGNNIQRTGIYALVSSFSLQSRGDSYTWFYTGSEWITIVDAKAGLISFSAINQVYEEDADSTLTNVTGVRDFLKLEILEGYLIGDHAEFKIELPIVIGTGGNSEILLELIYNFGGASEFVVATETTRVGNSTISINTLVTGTVTVTRPESTIGLYATLVSGTITVDGTGTLSNFMQAAKITQFSFRAYPNIT